MSRGFWLALIAGFAVAGGPAANVRAADASQVSRTGDALPGGTIDPAGSDGADGPAPQPAPAAITEPGEALFVEGQKAETAGDADKACGIYRDVFAKYPDSPSAPSALFQCGFLLDQRSHDVNGALEMYRKVLEQFPKSRAAARIEKRLPSLIPYEGKWATQYREFQGLMDTRKELGDEEWEKRLLAMLDANRDYPEADEYLFFLAKTAFKKKRYEDARRYYQLVYERYPGTLSSAFALKGLGDLEFVDKRYSASAAYYDAATALAVDLGMPPPSPGQRIKAHLYESRYRVLLVSFVIGALALIALVPLVPPRPDWKPLLKSWLGVSLALLPLFAILAGAAGYLAFKDSGHDIAAWMEPGDHANALPDNISGREPRFIAACYLLASLSVLIAVVAWSGAASKPRGRLLFWTSFPVLVVVLNYGLFYWMDLVFYLEAIFLKTDPKTGLPILPWL